MKFRHFAFAALASVMAISACEQEVNPVNPDSTPEFYTVRINCAGELDVTQVPLTRFTPDNKDLYAVQVYYKPNSGGSYKPYAYGLYDDISSLTVELLADYKYSFAIDMIDNAKDIVYCDSVLIDTKHYLGYAQPFMAYNGYNASTNKSITKLMNDLVYSEDYHFDTVGGFSGNSYGNSSIKFKDGSLHYDTKDVDRYFGYVTDYNPSEEGEEVSVFMKRMAYGIKIVAGDFLTEGTLTVTNDDDPIVLTPANKEYEAVYCYGSPYGWYNSENPSTTRSITFIWNKADGTSVSLKTQRVYFNRLKQTIINVEFYEDEAAGDAKLKMLYDEEPILEGESHTFGDDQSEYDW